MRIDNNSITRRPEWPDHLFFRRGGGEYRITPWEQGLVLERREPVAVGPVQLRLPGLPPAGAAGPANAAMAWRPPEAVPDLTLVSPRHFSDCYKSDYFLRAIPRPYRAAVEPFTYMQYSVLRLLRLSPYGLQALRTAPVLTWLLAVHMGRGNLAPEAAAELLGQRQNRIVAAVFGEDSGVTKNLIRKITGCRFTPHDHEVLTVFLGSARLARALRHCAACPLPGLGPFLRHPEAVELNAVRALFGRSPFRVGLAQKTAATYRDAMRFGAALGLADPYARLKRAPDLETLGALHDRWSRRLEEKLENERVPNVRFPPPVIPGDAAIRYIDNYRDLKREGEELSHCVVHYAEDVLAGTSWIYRVMKPERGTLELKRTGRTAYVNQFFLACNALPSPESQRKIDEWVRKGNGPAKRG
ncbi:hypothetical protein DND132_2454 [Pseudodesulfovibrio mercurii]|uniref:PcfJ-like protein n=1 Tax=Pseudodesulfovibrio mercurii TaxID=641491 RepID=F0JCH7_9BACT|nr:PcfJ domain-containing protein [Pseudodesulfovibrio mercurii]EGB15657.1 hypothetical protein DND132_2454 [Pseudodesulfovibrio mercurii]